MKHKKSIVTLLLLTAAFSVAVAKSANIENILWQQLNLPSATATLQLNGGKAVYNVRTIGTQTMNGTYKIGDGTLTISDLTNLPFGLGFSGTYVYTIQDDMLILSQSGKEKFKFKNANAPKKTQTKTTDEKEENIASNRLEFTASPAIGLSATAHPKKEINATLSTAQFDLGLNATMIGVPMVNAQTHKWEVFGKKITLMINAEIGMGGKLKLKTKEGSASAKPEKAGSFLINAFVGYTFEPLKNVYLIPAIGCGFGYYNISTTGLKGITTLHPFVPDFSIPLYLSAKYFFTDLVGIEATALNSFSFGQGFKNTFVLKVGPVFRFGVKV